jgi:DNA adenine methylase
MSMNSQRPAAFHDTPVLRYFGSKWKIADWIVEAFPRHELYVEPFMGSCSIFLRKPASTIEVLNDLNGRVVNFFRQLRDNTDSLVRAINLTPYALDEYHEAHVSVDEPLEDARRFYVMMWQSFGSVPGSGWRRHYRLNTGRRASLTDSWDRIDGLMFAATALKSAMIDNLPAADCITKYDGHGTLFYLDPPYLHSTRSRPDKARYELEMTEDEHVAMAAVLRDVRGMVVLSGYDSPLYNELFAGWQKRSRPSRTNGGDDALECLWLSPSAVKASKQMRLWGE